jgi:hypothetical protein
MTTPWPAAAMTPGPFRYSGSFLVMVNQFGMTAACFMSRGFSQGATPSPRVVNLLFDLVHTIARAGRRAWMLQGSLTPSSSSGLADATALHTKGPDTIPAMTIWSKKSGPISVGRACRMLVHIMPVGSRRLWESTTKPESAWRQTM